MSKNGASEHKKMLVERVNANKGTEENPKSDVFRYEKLLKRHQRQRRSFSRLLHTLSGIKLLLPQTADK